MKYNAVIFDFDGTIAYTAEDVWDSIEYAANRLGSIMPDKIKNDDSNLALSTKELFYKLNPMPTLERFEDFDKDITIHYRKISNYSKTFMYPDIEGFIRLLINKNIPRYIVTMKPREPLERILKIKGWEFMFDGWYTPDYFDGIIYAKEELIEILINKKLKGYKSVYIGDSYTDVIAARKNEIDCIGVTYGDGDLQKLINQEPTYVFNNVNEIIRLFL